MRVLARAILLLLVLAAHTSAYSPSLAVQVSSEVAPACGWTQIKVFANGAAGISAANISMDLDPSVFADITGVTAFRRWFVTHREATGFFAAKRTPDG